MDRRRGRERAAAAVDAVARRPMPTASPGWSSSGARPRSAITRSSSWHAPAPRRSSWTWTRCWSGIGGGRGRAAGRRRSSAPGGDPGARLLVVPPGRTARPSRGAAHARTGRRRALARACRTARRRATAAGGSVLTGGLTARACLLALGVSGLRLEREPLPGIAAGDGGGRGLGRAPGDHEGGRLRGAGTRCVDWCVRARRDRTPSPLRGAYRRSLKNGTTLEGESVRWKARWQSSRAPPPDGDGAALREGRRQGRDRRCQRRRGRGDRPRGH